MSGVTTSTPQPIPHLSFDGNCAEAMRFYETALGGKIKFMMKAGESPMADKMPPEMADMVLNAQLELPGGFMLYGGDCPPHMPYPGIHGACVTLNYNTVAEGEAVFNTFADGGRVDMAYEPTFWAEKFGMVTDKFGVHWIINGILHGS